MKIIVCFLFLMFFIPSSVVLCGQIDHFSVRSEYKPVDLDSNSSKVIWIFNKTENYLTVERNGSQKPLLRLKYSTDHSLLEVAGMTIKDGKFIPETIQSYQSPVVLSEGFPVPYDYVSASTDSSDKLIFRKKVGGMVFARKLKKNTTLITVEHAETLGYIDAGIRGELPENKMLQLITLTSGDKTVLRQLWPSNSLWWIYEDTLFRKSWLITPEPLFDD